MTSLLHQDRIDIRLIVVLNAILLFAASAPIAYELRARHYDEHPEWREMDRRGTDQLPLMAGFRKEDGTPFMLGRIGKAPFHYLGAHIIPAAIWCLLIPFQHSDAFRGRYPRIHRWMGRAVLLSNAVLIISGVLLAPRSLSYTHRNFFHLHGGWLPTFEAGTTIVAIVQAVTLYYTWKTARQGQYAKHRDWARLFTWAGLTITLQRVFMGVAIAAGSFLASVPDWRAKVMRVPSDHKGVSAVELAVFSWTTWMALFTTAGATWLKASRPRAKVA